jgi:hypothetical protein
MAIFHFRSDFSNAAQRKIKDSLPEEINANTGSKYDSRCEYVMKYDHMAVIILRDLENVLQEDPGNIIVIMNDVNRKHERADRINESGFKVQTFEKQEEENRFKNDKDVVIAIKIAGPRNSLPCPHRYPYGINTNQKCATQIPDRVNNRVIFVFSVEPYISGKDI